MPFANSASAGPTLGSRAVEARSHQDAMRSRSSGRKSAANWGRVGDACRGPKRICAPGLFPTTSPRESRIRRGSVRWRTKVCARAARWASCRCLERWASALPASRARSSRRSKVESAAWSWSSPASSTPRTSLSHRSGIATKRTTPASASGPEPSAPVMRPDSNACRQSPASGSLSNCVRTSGSPPAPAGSNFEPCSLLGHPTTAKLAPTVTQQSAAMFLSSSSTAGLSSMG